MQIRLGFEFQFPEQWHHRASFFTYLIHDSRKYKEIIQEIEKHTDDQYGKLRWQI